MIWMAPPPIIGIFCCRHFYEPVAFAEKENDDITLFCSNYTVSVCAQLYMQLEFKPCVEKE